MLMLSIVLPKGPEGIFGGALGAHFHDQLLLLLLLLAPPRQLLFPRPRPRPQEEVWLNTLKYCAEDEIEESRFREY